MEKAQILDRIRNKLTLPRAMLQIMDQLNHQQKAAIQEIDELIQELENETFDK